MAQSPRPRRSIVATRHPPFVHNRSANPSSATELHAATSPMWSTVGVDGSRRFGRQQLAWNANLAVARELDLPCLRSEERRVGKECRSRLSPQHEKKNTT